MQHVFAQRTNTTAKSFIREILKVTEDPEIISFAGGLPNPAFFPIQEMAEAAAQALSQGGAQALQYSTTEGYRPLRQWIADRYRTRFGLEVDPDSVLITAGSQQCLDLVAKVYLDPGDLTVIERPGYLGLIQSFSMFQSAFAPVELEPDGPDLAQLELALEGAKLFYAVPNFQNPSGLSYSPGKRQAVADLLKRSPAVFVEDDPYGELRFAGEPAPPIHALVPDRSLLLGSFSKIAAPGLRLGWITGPPEAMAQLITAKQASDLHTATFTQRILHTWLATCDLDAHIRRICECYGRQRDAMLAAIERHFPPDVAVTRPEGGMFLWATLPPGASALALIDKAIARKVAFVPGNPFYTDGGGERCMRLNFSNSDPDRIETGIRRLGQCLAEYLKT